jgi:hypothetical protein
VLNDGWKKSVFFGMAHKIASFPTPAILYFVQTQVHIMAAIAFISSFALRKMKIMPVELPIENHIEYENASTLPVSR